MSYSVALSNVEQLDDLRNQRSVINQKISELKKSLKGLRKTNRSTKSKIKYRHKKIKSLTTSQQDIPTINKFKKGLGRLVIFEFEQPELIQESNIQNIMNTIKVWQHIVKEKFPSAKNILVRLTVVAMNKEVVSSLATSIDNIEERLSLFSKNHSTDPNNPYMLFLQFVSFLVTQELQGGCSKRKGPIVLNVKDNKYTFYNPKSKGNNCFIQCLIKYTGINCNANKVRDLLKIKRNILIDLETTKKIAEHFKIKSYCILINDILTKQLKTNIKNRYKIVLKIGNDDGPIFMLDNEHYSLHLKTEIINKNHCSFCGADYIDKHKCSKQSRLYYQKKVLGKTDQVINTGVQDNSFYDNVYFKIEYNDELKPSHVGWYDSLTNEYYYNTFNQFILLMLKLNNRNFIAYKGCINEFRDIMNKLITPEPKIIKQLMDNGDIIEGNIEENKEEQNDKDN